MNDLSRRVLARYRAQVTKPRGRPMFVVFFDDASYWPRAADFPKMADAAPGQRAEDNRLTKPINPPKGIDREIVRENARTESDHIEETATPHRRDIQPKDVFTPKPRNMNVLNFAETGKDQDRVLRESVPKDKGWDTVKNLSQYLVRTEGGGGTPPVGKP